MMGTRGLQRIVAGVCSDLTDYRRLRELLDAQFAAALRHSAEETRAVAAQIVELTTILDGRRRERVALVGALRLGDGASLRPLHAVSARLPDPLRDVFESRCATLEALVRECKRINRRNSHLLTAQHDVMRQLLDPEAGIYAPA